FKAYPSTKNQSREAIDAPQAADHQPKIFANTNGATIVASDSITNRGVSTFSFPHVIFSFGTAPEYEPKLVVESLIWQKYAHSGTGVLTTSWFNIGTTQIGKSPAMPPPIWKKPMGESFDTRRYQFASSIMYSIPERIACTLLMTPVMQ